MSVQTKTEIPPPAPQGVPVAAAPGAPPPGAREEDEQSRGLAGWTLFALAGAALLLGGLVFTVGINAPVLALPLSGAAAVAGAAALV
ncbi:MAG: hypothetical protein HKM95_04465, partial [Inquilinus sp.]|nr:hypothetical protein [Inquilinus sp.]